MLGDSAKRQPNKTAYIFQDKATTYKEMDDQINRFAHVLQELGYKKGDHIALVLWNSPYFVTAFYGALRIGVVVIPINPMFTANELGYILNNAKVKGLVTMDVLSSQFEKMEVDLPNVSHYFFCDSGENDNVDQSSLSSNTFNFNTTLENSQLHYKRVDCDEDDTAMMLYTSGTTGHPKGTMLTYKNVYANAFYNTEHLEYNENDLVIATLPMVHAFCLGVGLCGPLLRGATVLIVPKFSPAEVFRIAKKYKATIFAGVPTMYSYLLQTAEKDAKLNEAFRSIRLFVSSGASLPVTLLYKFEKIFKAAVIEGYGLSEAASVSYNPVNHSRKAGSIGRPVGNVEMKVVDEQGNELAVGEEGELIISGSSVMKGYFNLPQVTSETLINGWLYTGDIARMDEEGFYYIVDRKKDIIIVSGYNVYPKEVEEVLYSNPYVKEAAVISQPHPTSGESVVAYVSLNNHTVTEEVLLQYCKERLAKYKVPVKVKFLKELPKNPTGKIMKKSLRIKSKKVREVI